MKNEIISLDNLKPGRKGIVKELKSEGPIRRRLQDLGFVPGVELECSGRSPGGDPAAYLIKETVIALRDEDSRKVLIELSPEVI